MEVIVQMFGNRNGLNALQMVMRLVIVFFICLVLVRVSGRRSFGMTMPLDNVTTILLGAILSQAVIGSAPFIGTIAAATALAVLHRLCGWLSFYYPWANKILKGTELILYKNGKYFKENMLYGMVNEEDILSEIRLNGNLDSLEKVESIFLERDGKISVIKKKIKIKF